MKEIELKILPQYFAAVKEGAKTFEIRKNDRGFKVGDTILLQEFKPLEVSGYFTGQEITKEISYILEDGQYGLEEGYCILGLKQVGIVFKNIDLTGISEFEQTQKVIEEQKEFAEAYFYYSHNKTENNKIHVMDELLDEFQSKLGLLEKEGIKAEEVQAYYSTWVKKLDNRPRIKKCNKCIKYLENPNNENIFICSKDSSELKIDVDIAKECKCYEE